MAKPLLICLTSTRNYGWVTSAFLKANSMWADYIIMVDQKSTDGTREMALSNPKVIYIENDDLSYSETKRSQLAIDRARQIEGDKILFSLAIDEVLPANFQETSDWLKILNSKPGDVFCFDWANLLPDMKSYFSIFNNDGTTAFMARLFHDDGITPYDNQGRDMHTHCIPYPQKDLKEYIVNDFKILHFAVFSPKWNTAKQRFYQLVDFDKNGRPSTVLSRMYNRWEGNRKVLPINEKWIYTAERNGFDLFEQIDTKDTPFLDNMVIEFINKNGIDRYRKLDIWDNEFLEMHNLNDPRSWWIKIIHYYFKMTRQYTSNIIVRIVDKSLKKMTF